MINLDDKLRMQGCCIPAYVLLCMHLLYLLSYASQSQYLAGHYGSSLGHISFLSPFLWLGMILLLAQTNFRLFYIREVNKTRFLMEKYDLLPITRKEQFRSKIKMLFVCLLRYFLLALLSYGLALLCFTYSFFILGTFLKDVLIFAAASTLIMAALLSFDLLQSRRSSYYS